MSVIMVIPTKVGEKKKLSQRRNYLFGIKVQRHMYGAFLIISVKED